MTVSGKRSWTWPAAAVLLLLHFLLSFTASLRNSTVADEPYHLARGAGLVFFHDFSFSVAHPPLANFLNALPLLTISDLKLPDAELVSRSRVMDPSDRRNAFARLLVQELNPDTRKIITRARIPTMILSVLLGLLVFLWAKELFGEPAGLLALFLYCLDPNLMAHSNLATNDLAAAFFISLSLYFYWRWWRSPAGFNLGLAGIFLGLAQLSKFTAVLLYPLFLMLWLISFSRLKKNRPELGWVKLKRPDFHLNSWSVLIIFLLSLLVIWAGYGFQGSPRWNFGGLLQGGICSSEGLTGLVKCSLVGLLEKIPLPPRTFYYGFAQTLLLTEQHENALYFWGMVGQKGWWYYYPVLFLIKTPLPTLILFALALGARKKIRAENFSGKLFLLAPAAWFFLCFVLLNRKELGIRHLLMIYPLIFIFCSGLAALAQESRRLKIWIGVLLAWLAISSLITWPSYLTYFNEAVGRRYGGLKISVLGEDWGQDLPALAAFQKKHHLYPLYYQPYVIGNPGAYGLVSQGMNCDPAQPGYYAIHLTQLVRPTKNPALSLCIALLKPTPPLYRINGAIWVWKINEPTRPAAPPAAPSH